MTILPKPDEFGNYWIGVNHKDGPAIFPHKKLVDPSAPEGERQVVRTGTFTLLVSQDHGFATDLKGDRIHFENPTLALRALNAMAR